MRVSIFLLLIVVPLDAAEPALTIDLWPAKAPGEVDTLPPEKSDVGPKDTIRRVSNVSVPQLSIYKPTKPNGTFVLIAPGGGYSILAYEHEGTQVAEWLNTLGITAGLLKYRVPKRKGVEPAFTPMLQDSQRALSHCFKHATEWGVDVKKIGMLGFSAGGHLTAATCTAEKRAYDKVDALDEQPYTPSFAVLVYPGGIVESDGTTLKPEFKITKATPPMFFAHASDDKVPSEGSIALYRALKAANVPAELHLFASGGHGFGMKADHPCYSWTLRCRDWFITRGLVAKAP